MQKITFSDLRKMIVFATKLIFVISTLMVLSLICYQIILRYVLHSPLLGLEEMAMMVVLWVWFFGVASSCERRFHVRGRMPWRQSDAAEVVISFVSAIVTLIYLYLCYRYCQWVVQAKVESVALRIPWIYAVSGVFLGLLLGMGYLIEEVVAKYGVFCQARK